MYVFLIWVYLMEMSLESFEKASRTVVTVLREQRGCSFQSITAQLVTAV